MLKSLYRKVCSATVVLTVSMSLTGGLHAHDGEPQSKNTKDIEAHREMDFGFDGFDTLNKRLQRDFEAFRLDAGAAEYMSGFEMAAAANSYLTGQWSPVFNLPIVPIHNAVLPTGKILMWDSVGDLPAET